MYSTFVGPLPGRLRIEALAGLPAISINPTFSVDPFADSVHYGLLM